ITASGQITLSGTSENRGGLLMESRQGAVDGELIVRANELVVEDGADISVSTNTGSAGDVTITVADSVRLTGDGTELAAQARRSGGTAGNITLITRQVTVEDGASILASNQDAANGGSITLNGLESLEVKRGRISAETETGVAGNLSINATDSVQLTNGSVLSVETGASENSVRRTLGRQSRNIARTTRPFIPTAGNLDIDTNRLVVEGGSSILVSSPNGQAGNITINGRYVELDNGNIRATTSVNALAGDESANITIRGLNSGLGENLDLLLLDNNSLVSAEALAGANGGNITLDATGGFIIAALNSNSDLIANAIGGNGGRIEISALQLFGFEINPGEFEALRANQTSDISVSSTLGTDGVISVDSLGIDPVQAAAELATNTTPPPLSQGCQAGGDQGEFTNTGRGGLHANPLEPISHGSRWEDIQSSHQVTASSPPSSPNQSNEPNPMAKIETWSINDDGDIILTNDPTEYTSTLNCQPQDN
ncbi:MAG: hypothetical protein AB4042_06230, partial [Leptolyngbyaceae cyanobacterium]